LYDWGYETIPGIFRIRDTKPPEWLVCSHVETAEGVHRTGRYPMSKTPVILFRHDGTNGEEYEIAGRFLPVTTRRTACRDNLVVGRYSVLPFYGELALDLIQNHSLLINPIVAHSWIVQALYHADPDLKPFLPRAWNDDTFPRSNFSGPFVVKGRTNSRKHQWSQKMFAADRQAAILVACALRDDPVIGPQGILYREYIPLRSFGEGLNGLPWANEWRCFYLGERRLAHGYYWSEAPDAETRIIDQDALLFADAIARIVAHHVPFFVLDVAERADGGWLLVDVNDAQMSGLSLVPAETLYANLKEALETWDHDAWYERSRRNSLISIEENDTAEA
jgi:hypothetical protein